MAVPRTWPGCHCCGSPRTASSRRSATSGTRAEPGRVGVRPADPRLDPDTVSGCRVGGVMFTIGDFARHGQVSVRMLRHYDTTELLRPARVDPASGYRFYEAAQLARLNR